MTPALDEHATDGPRVAVVLDGLPTATETFLRRHVEALRAEVVALYRNGDLLDTASVASHVCVLDAGSRPRRTLARRAAGRVRDMVGGAPVPRWPARMRELWARYVRERRPDVVLAEFGPNGVRVMDACREAGIPLVVHFHGYDASSLLRVPSYRRALVTLFAAAAAVVAVSRDMRERLVANGCPPAKVHVVPCGAAVDEITSAAAVAEQPCQFVAVGRLVPIKDPLSVLRAFEHVAAEDAGVRLRMLGDGPLLSVARRSVRRSGLSGRVELPGHVPWTRVRSVLAESSAFVQHSVTTRNGHVEGWGVALAEAAAAGLPTVATRSGGIPDQVVDGQTGYLVEEGDVDGMAEAMLRLARSPELRRTLGAAGRERIRQVGDAKRQSEELRKLLHLVTTEGNAS